MENFQYRVFEDFPSPHGYLVLDSDYIKPGSILIGSWEHRVQINRLIHRDSNGRCFYDVTTDPYFSAEIGDILKYPEIVAMAHTIENGNISSEPISTSNWEEWINSENLKFGLYSGQFYNSHGNTVIIEETFEEEPLYLDSELVPDQFFGLNDYLKTIEWRSIKSLKFLEKISIYLD